MAFVSPLRPPSERAAKLAAEKLESAAKAEAVRQAAEEKKMQIAISRGRTPTRTPQKRDRSESTASRSVSRSPRTPGPPPKDILESFMQFTPTTLVLYIWGDGFTKWQEENKTETSSSIKAREAAINARQPEPKPDYHYPTGRSVLELMYAKDQCVRTIKELKENEPCYICGQPIGPPFPKNGLTAECEHILSVAQAILLYNLFQSGDEDIGFFQREYKWAHELCNQEKSDTNIIKYTAERGFEFDNAALGVMLTKIYNSSRRGGDLLRRSIKQPVQTWRAERMKKVQETVKPLLDYLKQMYTQGGDKMFALVAATNVLDRVKEDFKKIEADPALLRSAGDYAKEMELFDDDGLDAPIPPSLGLLAEAVEFAESSPDTKRAKIGGKRRKTRRHRLPKLL